MKRLKVGTAVMSIDLPLGMDLTGYIGRVEGAAGIHDPLRIKTIIFDDNLSCFILVMCELLGLSSAFSNETTRLVGEKLGVPADHVVIACTHTHSGPASIFLQNCGEVDERWLEGLQKGIVECTQEAYGQLKPSQLHYGTGLCSVGINRVLKRCGESDEGILLKHTDSQVGVLSVHDEDSGQLQALVVNYSCHPVVLDRDNLLYSADYPSCMEQVLKKEIAPEVDILFTNGCCGDIDPQYRGGFEKLENAGRQLANAVIDTIRNDERTLLWEEQDAISVQTYVIDIPLVHHLNMSDLEQFKSKYEEKLQVELRGAWNEVLMQVYKAHIHWTERMMKHMLEGRVLKAVRADIKVIRIGELFLVTLPFEVFHDIGLKIKAHFGKRNTLVMGYSNGDFGYLPSKTLYHQSEYETRSAFIYYGYPGPVSEKAEDIILEAIFQKNANKRGGSE